MSKRATTYHILAAIVCLCSPAARADAIVNTLNGLDPSTVVSVLETGGITIAADQSVGPEFTLISSALIVEIGAFVNNCNSLTAGVPTCPNMLPFIVKVVGVTPDESPDLTTVYGTYSLPLNADPLSYLYEFVQPDLGLNPGTYYAMFEGQPDAEGAVLSSAPSYLAGSVDLGVVDSSGSSSSDEFAAFQIQEASVPEPASFILLGMVLLCILPRISSLFVHNG